MIEVLVFVVGVVVGHKGPALVAKLVEKFSKK